MINIDKLQLVEHVAYALAEIEKKMTSDEWEAFNKYLRNKPLYTSPSGDKCIIKNDLQLYVRLRKKALQKTA